VGDEAFIAAVMKKKASATVSKINLTKNELRHSHKQTLHCLTYYCLQPLYDHWLQNLLPRHAQLFAQEVDDALNKVLEITLAPGVLQCDYAKHRVRLPARHTGAGIRSCGPADQDFSVKGLAAFVGATSKAVSEMLDRESEDGHVVPGYSTGLEPLIGAGSFDGGGGLFSTLVSGGSDLGAALRSSWVVLQAGAAPPGQAAPSDGILRKDVEDLGHGTPHLQRELTRQVEGARALALQRKIQLLPAGDPRRESHDECVKDPVMRRWTDMCPTPSHSLPNTYFVDLTADYFGLAVPECLRSASTVVPGARGADKLVGPRGAVLTSATCKGDGWRTQHDSAQYFQWRALKDHGVRAELERYGLFGDVFDELHRAHPEMWGKVDERKRHAAVPDTGVFFNGEPEVLFEHKVMHENPTRYPPCSRGGAFRPIGICSCGNCCCRQAGARRVDVRAGTVNKEVAAKLAKLERKLGGLARGEVGPLQRRLDELGGVTPLVAGAFGGVNEAWHSLNRKMVDLRAERVWSKMLFPSMKQCKGVLLVHHQRSLCVSLAYGRAHLRHSRLQSLLYGVGGGFRDAGYDARKQEQHDYGRQYACGGARRSNHSRNFADGMHG